MFTVVPQEIVSKTAPTFDKNNESRLTNGGVNSAARQKAKLHEKLAKLNSRYVGDARNTGEKRENTAKVGFAAIQDIAARQEAGLSAIQVQSLELAAIQDKDAGVAGIQGLDVIQDIAARQEASLAGAFGVGTDNAPRIELEYHSAKSRKTAAHKLALVPHRMPA